MPVTANFALATHFLSEPGTEVFEVAVVRPPYLLLLFLFPNFFYFFLTNLVLNITEGSKAVCPTGYWTLEATLPTKLAQLRPGEQR